MDDATATGPSVPPLQESLAQLKAIMTRYRGAKAHWISDLIPYNFAMDVREQSEAILALSGTVGRRAAYANARAALESARDLAFLTTDEGQYDFRAARAGVFEVFENAELERRAPYAPEASGQPPAPAPPPEDILIQDAKDWEDVGPGMGTVMRRAIEDVQRDKNPLRKHWSRLTQPLPLANVEFPREVGDSLIRNRRDVIVQLEVEVEVPPGRQGNAGHPPQPGCLLRPVLVRKQTREGL